MRFLIALATVMLGVLLWTLPAKSQDCIAPEATLKQLDDYTKANNIQAQAWLWQSDQPAIKLMIIWFSNVQQAVIVSAFKDGCLVIMPENGKSSQVIPISPDVQHAVGNAEMIYDNGVRNSPFTKF